MLSRQSTERQSRIDRMQQRVQQLQSQKPEGLRAQRAQERLLQTQNRLLQREQRMQQSDQARLQRLAPPPSAERTAATAPAATRGRFAAHFRSNDALQARTALTARENGWAPRHAWRRGHRAAFVAWLGPVFWPYAYSDIFSYTFWPTAYDPGYWAYAYDDFVDTVFWGTDSPYSAYARYPEPGAAITDYRARGRASVSPQTLRQLCADPDKGVTAWPIAEITRAVRPTPEQRALLDELKTAAAKAADVFKESCADSYAMTPPGRLRAMTNRVSATLNAVKDRTAGTRAVLQFAERRAKSAFQRARPEHRRACAAATGSECSGRGLRRSEIQSHPAADRTDRGCRTAGWRAKGSARPLERRDQEGGCRAASCLPGRRAAYADRAAGRDGEAAQGHARGSRLGARCIGQVLCRAEQRAEGALQYAATDRKPLTATLTRSRSSC